MMRMNSVPMLPVQPQAVLMVPAWLLAFLPGLQESLCQQLPTSLSLRPTSSAILQFEPPASLLLLLVQKEN